MKKTRESPAFKDAKIATLEEIIEMLKYEVKELKNEIAALNDQIRSYK